MAKFRSVGQWFKPGPVWFLWAALLLPVVEGIAVPFRPRPGEVN